MTFETFASSSAVRINCSAKARAFRFQPLRHVGTTISFNLSTCPVACSRCLLCFVANSTSLESLLRVDEPDLKTCRNFLAAQTTSQNEVGSVSHKRASQISNLIVFNSKAYIAKSVLVICCDDGKFQKLAAVETRSGTLLLCTNSTVGLHVTRFRGQP